MKLNFKWVNLELTWGYLNGVNHSTRGFDWRILYIFYWFYWDYQGRYNLSRLDFCWAKIYLMIPYKGPQKDALWQFFQDVRKTMFVPYIPGFRLGKKHVSWGQNHPEMRNSKPSNQITESPAGKRQWDGLGQRFWWGYDSGQTITVNRFLQGNVIG